MRAFAALVLAACVAALSAHAAPKRGPLGAILGVPFEATVEEAQAKLGANMREVPSGYSVFVRKFVVTTKLYGETIPLVLDFEGGRGLFGAEGHIDLGAGRSVELEECYARARAIVARMDAQYGASDEAPQDPHKELARGYYALLGLYDFSDGRYVIADIRGCDFEVRMSHVVYVSPPKAH